MSILKQGEGLSIPVLNFRRVFEGDPFVSKSQIYHKVALGIFIFSDGHFFTQAFVQASCSIVRLSANPRLGAQNSADPCMSSSHSSPFHARSLQT